MYSRVSSLMVALALIVVAAGCSKAPEGELKASEEALNEAQVAEATEYAPALYQQAIDTLNAAKTELQKQDARFSAFRSYGTAKEIIATAEKLADSARTVSLAALAAVILHELMCLIPVGIAIGPECFEWCGKRDWRPALGEAVTRVFERHSKHIPLLHSHRT